MRSVVLKAVSGALLIGAAAGPAIAESYYDLSVEILGDNGDVKLHQQIRCQTYEPCLKELPATIEGKPVTIYLKARLRDAHHIAVSLAPPFGKLPNSPAEFSADPFDPITTVNAFESGNEWTTELKRLFKVPIDPSKRKFNWETTEQQRRTVLKLRMKLDG